MRLKKKKIMLHKCLLRSSLKQNSKLKLGLALSIRNRMARSKDVANTTVYLLSHLLSRFFMIIRIQRLMQRILLGLQVIPMMKGFVTSDLCNN
jgi:hypothetical protein